MPRDGSGIYEQPFENVETGTTIESTVYNGFTRDVEADLNAARPIIAGGTGASSADQALVNLGAEKAGQYVTDYDNHVFYPGSFRSPPTATGMPVAGHSFAGVAYTYDSPSLPPINLNVVIEARDLDDADHPGAVYVRQRSAGVWGLWMAEVRPIHGNCRLDLQDVSTLRLARWNGNRLTDGNGTNRLMPPSTSITATAAALGFTAASQTRNIFAYDSNGDGYIDTLEGVAGPGAYVMSGNGVFHKTGDPTRVMVGMCRTSDSGIDFSDAFNAGKNRCRSYFNEESIQLSLTNVGGSVSSAHPTWAVVTAAADMQWLQWGWERAVIEYTGDWYVSANGNVGYGGISILNSTPAFEMQRTQSNFYNAFSMMLPHKSGSDAFVYSRLCGMIQPAAISITMGRIVGRVTLTRHATGL